jgi:hypothetical protein
MIDGCLKEGKGVLRGGSDEVYTGSMGRGFDPAVERLSRLARPFVDRLPFLTLP